MNIEVIPHKEQRYDTCGDYWEDKDGAIQFRISDLSDGRYELSVLFHEMFELFRLQERGITIPSIDRFDVAFEDLRTKYPALLGSQEPGNMVSAPYHKEHVEATKLERFVLCDLFGEEWDAYDALIDSLEY